MPHHDLYARLHLDRSADCAVLAAEIDRLTATARDADAARMSELRTARAVLGDAGRRALYDRQLADPSLPPITLSDLEELAAMPGSGPASGTGAGYGTVPDAWDGAGPGVPSPGEQTLEFGAGANPYAPSGGQGGPGGPQDYGRQPPPWNVNPYAPGPDGSGGRNGYSGYGGYGAPGTPGGYGAPQSGSTTKWVVPAVIGALVVVAAVAVGAVLFLRAGGDGRHDTAAVTSDRSAPVTPEDHYPTDGASPSDSYSYGDEVSITGATAVSTTCGGRDCVRIEIALSGTGEPEIMDGFSGGELQVDIYGVEVAYQDSFPADDRTGGKLGYLRGTHDEYGWPRLAVGVPEGTGYTVDNDYRNGRVLVEVYV